ncbi:mannose-1-phosphate guanylyltransferase/mannose-6-phosphate isomerase [Azorhizobium oxalatiphilum]|uniref:mannose-1-phosphate guanylyltransferase n=1 Tax=Azorhizobium oxalatiphilum TaxID=980631 RepID=A0A917BZ03_9HYPH|nr:mannose-1-phosphate guanylyltransferase/mannose-6-phosphate isomerase [Azorhizobium oxalatiphilum]GGF62035.1 mannose-1-phosphate guanylyltransferase/mannose-6-phosphate isomerase [Azorhizobium oxalatiphilum]
MAADLKIVPVILAGGTGTRLWPLSRQSLPKQFLSLVSDHTLYQDTLRRVAAPDLFHPPVVLTNADFRFFARRQAAELGIDATVVLEPVARDSGPAVLAAAAYVRERYGKDALVLALAADHAVKDPDAFVASVRTAAAVAASGQIVTFGIKPSAPSTAYGYIKLGDKLAEGGYQVARFVEKPDVETATRYVADGYLWNSGNFLFRAELLLSEGTAFVPKMVEAATQAVAGISEDIGFLTLGAEAFTAAPSQSIDFAIMERTKHAAVVEGDFGWSDIGAWNSVREVSPADADGNVTRGPVALMDSHNSYVYSDSTLVAGIGLENVAVVATDDAILVMPADRSQDVKALVTALRASHPRVVDEHLRMHRPWGTYETICRGERFHVKKIVVNPGGKLSLQKHHHRAEHWVVVKGTAEVTLGNDVFTLNENESTYLPFGSIHRLANPGRIPLELIEVQTGSYLGEDDIVRIEDVYSRV